MSFSKEFYLYRSLILIFFGYLVAIGCDSGEDKLQPTFEPPDGKTLYLSHQHSLDQDEKHLFSQSGHDGPAGLVILTSVLMDMSTKLVEGRVLEDIYPVFAENQDVSPVFVMMFDKTLYSRLCKGEFDDRVERMANLIKKLDRPVYLTIGFEVNHPVYRNEPDFYIEAYRCYVDKLRAHDVPNVSFVWHVIGMEPGYQSWDPGEWYPGDEYVNWLGTSVTQFLDAHFVTKIQFQGPNFNRLFDIADQHDLPIMILESSSRGVQRNFEYREEVLWDFWYKPFFEMVKDNKRIKAVSHMSQEWLMDDYTWDRWKEEIDDNRYLFSTTELN